MNKIYEQYHREGCLKIENFLTPEEVEELKKGLSDVVENMADDDSYASSIYRIRTQKEPDDSVINSTENSIINSKVKTLHWCHSIFKKHSFSQKVKDLMKSLQYKDPVIVQSLLIFSEPTNAELINPHQDTTLSLSDPPTLISLGFLLEDVTLENGCLWYVPGSHKGDPVYQRRIQNNGEGPSMEGKFPEFSNMEYVPVPAKRGDCILLHGCAVHKNGHNMTEFTTAMYALLIVEKNAKWSSLNSIQPTEKLPFASLYSN